MTKKSTNNRRNVGADACITEFELKLRPRAVACRMLQRCSRPVNPLLAVSAMPTAAELAGDRLIAEAFALRALPKSTRSTVAVAKSALELSNEGRRG